jgi:hypothetical protein
MDVLTAGIGLAAPAYLIAAMNGQGKSVAIFFIGQIHICAVMFCEYRQADHSIAEDFASTGDVQVRREPGRYAKTVTGCAKQTVKTDAIHPEKENSATPIRSSRLHLFLPLLLSAVQCDGAAFPGPCTQRGSIAATINHSELLRTVWRRIAAQPVICCYRNIAAPADSVLYGIACIAGCFANTITGFLDEDASYRSVLLVLMALRLGPIAETLVIAALIFATLRERRY